MYIFFFLNINFFQACRMSCLALKQVQMCNCSEPKFPINSSACFSLEQRRLTNFLGNEVFRIELDEEKN